jgi:hypothetical protein
MSAPINLPQNEDQLNLFDLNSDNSGITIQPNVGFDIKVDYNDLSLKDIYTLKGTIKKFDSGDPTSFDIKCDLCKEYYMSEDSSSNFSNFYIKSPSEHRMLGK